MSSILFTTTDWPLSYLIRWATSSPCSHVSLGTTFGGVPLVLEADLLGVIATTRARFLASNRLVNEFRLPPEADASIENAMEVLGERYDYPALVGYIPVMIQRWLGRKAKNPFVSANAMVCVELLLELRLPDWASLDPDTCVPEDLRQICLKHPDRFTIGP